ncbi:hypothetical protein [Methylobacterium sp. ID0610]|uniref:hypothetical protein n=1 Tax=Methylobacterium carpenticola TaxID=3344827 RepID=UPI0036C3BF66
MLGAALLSALAPHEAATDAASVLRNPFPNAAAAIDGIIRDDDIDENGIRPNLYRVPGMRLERQPMPGAGSPAGTALPILGILTAGCSFRA